MDKQASIITDNQIESLYMDSDLEAVYSDDITEAEADAEAEAEAEAELNLKELRALVAMGDFDYSQDF